MSISLLLCILVTMTSYAPMHSYAALGPLRECFGWKELDFNFPNETAREYAIRSGDFISGNILPIDVQPVGNRIFLTMPRSKEGIPATLASIHSRCCKKGHSHSPRLDPYPNWSWNNGNKGCDGLTSVFRVNMDKCGRLWILDSGAVNIFSPDGMIAQCPPKLFVFDPSNDRLILKYQFPNATLKPDSLLITVALDTVSTANDCRNTYAYSADVTTYALIVTDAKRGNSWRVENKLFFPYPNWGRFTIAGESFDLMDGIFSLAVHPYLRRLYFHALASVRENYVRTHILHNATLANTETQEYLFSHGEKPSQAAASAFDSRGILFFGLLSSNSLACYNPRRKHNPSNIIDVAQDDVALQFASGVKVSKS